MFNRNPNVNRRQFAMVDDLDVSVPSTAPTHAKGESIPFAGGNFKVREWLFRDGEHTVVNSGTFITQSAQTVLPGTLSQGERYAEFHATPEQHHHATAGNLDQRIGINEEQIEGGGSEISGAVGHNEIVSVRPEHLGQAIRDFRAAARKEEGEDGGVAGFTMREWNALDEEGMTRRHFE